MGSVLTSTRLVFLLGPKRRCWWTEVKSALFEHGVIWFNEGTGVFDERDSRSSLTGTITFFFLSRIDWRLTSLSSTDIFCHRTQICFSRIFSVQSIQGKELPKCTIVRWRLPRIFFLRCSDVRSILKCSLITLSLKSCIAFRMANCWQS